MNRFQMLFCLLLLNVMLLSPLPAVSAPLQTVRIGAFNLYPTIFQAKDGSVQGFYVDFLKEIANREGWNIEYVYGSWADGLSRIKTGEVDVLTNVAFTRERAEFMDYGKTQLLTVWAELYVPTGSDIDNIRQVKGKKIALMKGDFNAANFRNLLEKFGIPCNLVEYGNFEEVFQEVSSRQVDGGIVNNTFGAAKQHEYDLKSSGVIFNPFDIYFTVAKGKNRQILETLDNYLIEWRNDESSPYHQARQRWAHGSASTIRVIPSWLRHALVLFLGISGVAVAFIIMLRIQVRRKTNELKSEFAERIKIADELHLTTEQLEEELAERQVAQAALEEQTALLEEEVEERVRAEADLLASEKRFRELLENVRMLAVTLDTQGTITFCNNFLSELSGWEKDEIVGKNWFDLFIPKQVDTQIKTAFNDVLAGDGVASHFENQIITRDGTVRTIVWDNTMLHNPDNSIYGIASIGIDVTDHRHLEYQLRHAQKMEAIGQLAGGVAHDFNNILTVIMGYANLLSLGPKLDTRQSEAAEQIISASEKAAQLTRGLLAFSRKQLLEFKITDLNQIMQHVQKFLVRIIGEDIKLKLIINDLKLPVTVDNGQIEQVLINLATNARDAMQKGGILTIETGIRDIDAAVDHVHGFDTVVPGRYACITVSDTGGGMDAETCARIFEPFFTTKEIGKGTGLGMAIVYGIVRQHNGFINVYSEPGVGTTFRVYLPVAEEEQGDHEDKEVPAVPLGGSETILLAEDDAGVRKLVATVLTQFGYDVIQAEDGQDAVDTFAANRDRIALIVMDMIMPNKNGKEAYAEISRLKPGVRILYCSGYTAEFMQSRGVSEEGIDLITKPVQPMELLRRIREKLDS
ncbi:MAG: transporter substrate-binding domain-containing protein [Pelobacteraceae bacterium]